MNKVKTQGNNCVLFVAMLSPVNWGIVEKAKFHEYSFVPLKDSDKVINAVIIIKLYSVLS